MSFGSLVPIATSGSVSISLNGTLTTNNVASVAPGGATYTSGLAVFEGEGLLGSVADVVSITPLSTSVTLTNSAGGTVTVDNFTTTPNLQISVASPSVNVYVGARMNFTSASTAGTYSGNIQLRGTSALGGSATVTIPITLTLWRPLSVAQTRTLNFGGIEMAGGNSVVTVNAATGERTFTSGVKLVSSRPGASGEFSVTGQPNTTVTVTLPGSITLTGPGAAMTVKNFTSSPTTATLDATGKLTLKTGASLSVGAAQKSGTYSGTYSLTVSY